MLIPIAITLLIITVKLAYDYNEWKHGRAVNHPEEWWLMVVAALPAVYFFTMESRLHWIEFDSIFLSILVLIACIFLSAAMMAFFIWLFFDGLYNKVRGYNWWFTGSEDADDAKTDNFLQGLKLWQHVLIKVGGLALFVTLYIIFKKA